jgi:C1A family cysteine protease
LIGAAVSRTGVRHGFGLDVRGERAASARAVPQKVAAAASLPASYDLSQYAPPPGDQGPVNSCSSWVTGYTGYGLLMNKQGLSGAPMAPMYAYSQIVKGRNTGTMLATNLQIMQDQGLDTKAHYVQGDFDYTTQPTTAERQNAAHYRLSGYHNVPLDGSLKQAIETAVVQGQAVIIGFQPRLSFEDVSADNPTYSPGGDGTDPVNGGHSVLVIGYNETGLKIENSWGPYWGAAGFATFPWPFVLTSTDITSVYIMHNLTPA